jgi:hypothetical protein
VHPVQPARHPETGLIEAHDIAGGDMPADLLQETVQAAGRPGGDPATVPGDSGMPNSSPRACAVRFLDRNWPMYR